jgi:hypothetical protein
MPLAKDMDPFSLLRMNNGKQLLPRIANSTKHGTTQQNVQTQNLQKLKIIYLKESIAVIVDAPYACMKWESAGSIASNSSSI